MLYHSPDEHGTALQPPLAQLASGGRVRQQDAAEESPDVIPDRTPQGTIVQGVPVAADCRHCNNLLNRLPHLHEVRRRLFLQDVEARDVLRLQVDNGLPVPVRPCTARQGSLSSKGIICNAGESDQGKIMLIPRPSRAHEIVTSKKAPLSTETRS